MVVQLFLAIRVLLYVVGIGVLPRLISLVACGLLNVPFAVALKSDASNVERSGAAQGLTGSEIIKGLFSLLYRVLHSLQAIPFYM